MSTRDTLRKAKPKIHPCEISTGIVHVRALSGAGRTAYLDLMAAEGNKSPQHKIAALGLCEEDGALSYDAASEKDLQELADVDGADLEKICLKLFEVSGLAKKAVDDAEKKSGASPST